MKISNPTPPEHPNTAIGSDIENDQPNVLAKRLRTYLISRFMIVLLISYAIGQTLDILLQLLYPQLERIFLLKDLTYKGSGFTRGLSILGHILGRILSGLMPGYMRLFNGFLSNIFSPIAPPAQVSQYGPLVSELYFSSMFLVFLLMVLLPITPYVIGSIVYATLIQKKVAELQAYDQEKRKAYEQQRNLMLADLAHDIKTPITTVVGYSQALRDHLIPAEKEEEYLVTLSAKALRISELINMLFDYVKMDSAGFELHTRDVDFTETALECCAEVYMDFEEQHKELDIDIPEVSYHCQADPEQLRRVIHNLLSNALKYTEDGSCTCASLTYDPVRKTCALSIADNGTAVEKELADHIFEPFSRGDKTRSTKGGSGLGLSIAHKIMTLHNGDLILDQNPDGQMTKAFVVIIPAHCNEEQLP